LSKPEEVSGVVEHLFRHEAGKMVATLTRIFRNRASQPCRRCRPGSARARFADLDAKVGGNYKMSFTNFTTGKSHSFGGTYVELTPHERIRYTDKFDDPNLPGEMQVTITLKRSRAERN